MSKIKSVSTYTRQDESSGYWSAPTPLGADIENIDITDQVSNPEVEWSADQIPNLSNSDVTVVSGDNGATAFTKFNRCKNLIQNISTGLKNLILALRQELTQKIYNFNGERMYAFYGISTANLMVQFPHPFFSSDRTLNLTNIRVYLPSSEWVNVDLSTYSLGLTPWGYTQIFIPINQFSTTQQNEIKSTPGHFIVEITGSVTFS